MKIVSDENIPFVKEVFGRLGEVHCLSGRAITFDTLKDAEVLLVRSITRVDADLLGDTNVRFVGTATIGTDHIDKTCLQERSICFADAAGSNANSVAQYVLTAISVLAEKSHGSLQGKTLGIIGVGNIGSILAKKCQALGLTPILNDPPRQRQASDNHFVDLKTALQADIITLHVPLTRTGPDPTWHLLNEQTLASLKPHQVLINTSRGAVVNNQALKSALQQGSVGPAVLDVWEGEPEIDLDLLQQVALGTPHIAGYSFDGKVNGTVMLYEAFCQFCHKKCSLSANDLLPAPPVPLLVLNTNTRSPHEVIKEAMTECYDILADDAALRHLLKESAGQRGAFFDQLRKSYPVRREMHNTQVCLQPPHTDLAVKLRLLGFDCS